VRGGGSKSEFGSESLTSEVLPHPHPRIPAEKEVLAGRLGIEWLEMPEGRAKRKKRLASFQKAVANAMQPTSTAKLYPSHETETLQSFY
jgi:hypothetical protein